MNLTARSIEPFGSIELHLISRMLVHYSRSSSLSSSPNSSTVSPLPTNKYVEDSQDVIFPKWKEPSNQIFSESKITNINIKKKFSMAQHTRITISKNPHSTYERSRKLESSVRSDFKSSTDSKLSQYSTKIQPSSEQFNTLAPFSIIVKDKQKRS